MKTGNYEAIIRASLNETDVELRLYTWSNKLFVLHVLGVVLTKDSCPHQGFCPRQGYVFLAQDVMEMTPSLSHYHT